MATRDKLPVVLPTDGNSSGDASDWTHVPTETVGGLGIKKDPQTGAWVALTVFPHLDKLGYVTARTPLGTRASKVRFVLTDHPDGPA